MKISRKNNLRINFVLNELIPPFIRDCPFIMWPAFKLMFGKKAHLFFDFRKKVYDMTDQEFARINADICDVIIERDTDLNQECLDRIIREINGVKLLEVGCGGGFLAKKLARNNNVDAVDVYISDQLSGESHENLRFHQASSEALPFDDKSFDIVVCTHTLEHVRDIQKTLAELRRVARNKLVIVVPKERPALYTFSLHIHFFPYEFSLLSVVGRRTGQSLENLGGDWFYTESYH